jgi:ubiquinone/menaquinone biosynthesis C-methylase UbiE
MVVEDHSRFSQTAVAENYRRYLQPYLFDPWARRLVDVVGLKAGQTVLDVAAGTGAVSRAAASAVGETGTVIASDVSDAMLAALESAGADGERPGAATIRILRCAAEDLDLPDASVDVVLCQQGFPFMPDRVAVAREMRRVLRPSGVVGVAVWAQGERLYPFDAYAEFVRDHLTDSEFAQRMARGSVSMSPDSVASALTEGGFEGVSVSLQRLTVQWPTAEDEAHGIMGTPFGPEISSLSVKAQQSFLTDLADRLAGAGVQTAQHVSVSVFALGHAPR